MSTRTVVEVLTTAPLSPEEKVRATHWMDHFEVWYASNARVVESARNEARRAQRALEKAKAR